MERLLTQVILTRKKVLTKNGRRLAIFTLATLALMIGVTVQAAGVGAPTRAIPFQGHLELDGQAPSGVYLLTFKLYDDATAGTLLFSEQNNIEVFAGDFRTLIGSVSALPDTAYTAAELFLEIDVDGTTLNGRQQIFASHRVVDPPGAFRTGTLTMDATQTTGLLGWGIAADIDGPSGAIRLLSGGLQLGFHSNGNLYVSDLDNAPAMSHQLVLEKDGNLNIGALSLPNSTRLNRMQFGTVGVCDNAESFPSSANHTFPVPFSETPVIIVTPVELDDAGCTSLRITAQSLTGFTTRGYALAAFSGCDCMHWMAFEP